MKHNKLLALALLSSLALVACGENKENNSSNNDNQGEIVNPSTDSNNSSDNGSTDNGSGDNGSSDNGDQGENEGGNTELPGGEDLPVVPEIPEADVTVDLKQEFFDNLKGALKAETARRGDLSAIVEGEGKAKFLKEAIEKDEFIEFTPENAIPDTTISGKLTLTRNHSENTFDGYSHAVLKSEMGTQDMSAYQKFWNEGNKYLAQSRSVEKMIDFEGNENVHNYNDIYQASTDEVENEFFVPLEDGVNSIASMPELENFAQIEDMITQLISNVKEAYNYEIVPSLVLSKDNDQYKIDLTVKGTGKLELFTYEQGIAGEENVYPFDALKDATANIQLYYTNSTIQYAYAEIKGDIIFGMNGYDEADNPTYIQDECEVNGNAYFKLSHNKNDNYLVKVVEDEENKVANPRKVVHSVGIDFTDSKPQFGSVSQMQLNKYYNNGELEQKIDLSNFKSEHSHIKLYRGLREIAEEDLKFKSYYQDITANLSVDEGYSLLVCTEEMCNKTKVIEVDLSTLENGSYTLDMSQFEKSHNLTISSVGYIGSFPTFDYENDTVINPTFNVESGKVYYLFIK